MLTDSKAAGAASSKAPRLSSSSASASTATSADFFSSRSSTDRSSSVAADGFSSNSDDNATSHSFGASSSITTTSALSPTSRSPWACQTPATCFSDQCSRLIRSLVREEGHIYSLAASGDLLYTGSDSKNIRVWKNQREFSVFKSNSGLVKSIVISNGAKIFTGHQDGKIRVWKTSGKNPAMHKRIGTLPTLKAFIRSSLRPSSYVEARRSRSAPWIRHLDAISSLSLSEDGSMLYSASWDRTVKVWRVSNFKCLESIAAHDDAVNAVVCGFDGLVFSGSADGTVKAWRRETQGKGTRHFFSQTLLKQDSAVTALAVNTAATTLYSGSSGGHVHFWERGDFSAPSGQLGAHRLAVLCLATAGSLVLSGSADTNICVWMRVGSGPTGHVLISTLMGHTGPVKCLAMEKDKEAGDDEPPQWVLYSGSLDKSVKIWRVSEHAPEEQSMGEDDPNASFW